MAAKKFSVFIMVVVFHFVVLGVVFLFTRSDEPETEIAIPAKKEVPTSTEDSGDTSGSNKESPKIKPPALGQHIIHVVKSGDYLGNIASKYKVTPKEIIELNNISDPDKIRLGQKIKIPLK